MRKHEKKYMTKEMIDLAGAMRQPNSQLVSCLRLIQRLNSLGKTKEIHDFADAIIYSNESDS
jgi:hypothetical protein